MKQLMMVLLAAAMLCGCDSNKPVSSPGTTGTTQEQTEVLKAATDFVTLVDQDRIDETWLGASPLLKFSTNKLIWVNGIQALRSSLGDVENRSPKGFGFTHQLPDAPLGKYAAVAYTSTFSATSVEEKVAVQKDQGQWKVTGYFVLKHFSYGHPNEESTGNKLQ
jgi:hypothetical protein